MLYGIKWDVKGVKDFSVKSIGDMAYIMENKKKMKQLHAILLITGIPISIVQWSLLILWIATGIWQPFALFVLMVIPCVSGLSSYYFRRTVYICPQCHKVFKPEFKEVFFAQHTPTLRKLTCTRCGHKGGLCRNLWKGWTKMNKIIEFLPFLIPLMIIQFSLLGYALYHILTHKNYKRGSRTLWLIITIALNFVGPILYFLLGKEDA